MQFNNILYELHFANHLVTKWGNVINKRNNKLVPSPFCPSLSKPTHTSSILYFIRLLPSDSFYPTFLHPKQKGGSPKIFLKTNFFKKIAHYSFISPFLSIKVKSQQKERKELSISHLPSLPFFISYPFSPCIFPSKKQGKSHRNTNKQKIKMCCTFSLTHPPYVFLGLPPSISFYFTHFPSKKEKGQKIFCTLSLTYFPPFSLSLFLTPFLSIEKNKCHKKEKKRTKTFPFLTLFCSFPLPFLSTYLQPNFINFHNIVK